MPKIQETLTVTFDDNTYTVADMSDNVKQMIALMDEWRQRDADLTSEVLMVRAAVRDVQNTLLATIREEMAAPAETPAAE